jgi:glycosyltransferase involved in cell wall biosynthesis
MKLVVLIPAYNEEKSIKKVVTSIPKQIHGIKTIEILVVNDGSVDNTIDEAVNAGASKVVSHKANMGVGAAFMTGIRNAVSMNADIVVTLDADSQFNSNQIPELLLPILNNQVDVVIGSRFLKKNPEKIPKIKLFGNKIFTRIISWALGQKFTDTQTGFRAYSKDAIMGISVVNEFTYTQEVLLDLKYKGFRIVEVPVDVIYDEKRKSRVVKSIFGYSVRALSIISKSLIYHRPILAFGIFGCMLVVGGIIGKILTITDTFSISPGLTTGFIVLGVVSFMLGVLANIVFKRQAFAERDLRHYVEEINKGKQHN